MSDARPKPPSPPRRRWPLYAGVAGLVLVVALGAVTIERRPIARRLVEDWLKDRKIDSRIEVEAIGLTGFIGRIRLGDPKKPGLSVERVEVDYSVQGPWNGQALGITTRAVRLVRPRLLATLHGGRLAFGDLQPLIDELLKSKPPNGPPPAIEIRDGEAVLAADAGTVTFRGDALIANNTFQRFDGHLEPFDLAVGAVKVSGRGGDVDVRDHGGVIEARAALVVDNLTAGDLALTGASLRMIAHAPAPPKKGGAYAGVADLSLWLDQGDARGAGVSAKHITGTFALPRADFAWNGQALGVSGQAELTAAADGVAGAGMAGDHAAFSGKATRLTAGFGPRGPLISADLTGGVTAGRLQTGDLTLVSVAMSGHGTLAGRPGRMTFSASGAASARGALNPQAAGRMAAQTPVLGGDGPYRAALAKALSGFRLSAPSLTLAMNDGRLAARFGAPASVVSTSGARLVLTGSAAKPVFAMADGGIEGAGAMTLGGGGLPPVSAQVASWSDRGGVIAASLTAKTKLDIAPAQGVDIQATANVRMAGDRTEVTLTGCAPISADRLNLGAGGVVQGVKGRLCPEGGPLFALAGKGWTARGRLEDGGARYALLATDIGGARAGFQANGDARGLTAAQVRLQGAALTDTSPQPRFNPLTLAGTADLTGALVLADVTATPKRGGRPLARLRVRQDQASGAGEADLDTGDLAFAQGGFQPTDISPLIDFLPQAHGVVAVKGHVAWSAKTLTSNGQVIARGLGFKSPLGVVTGGAANVRFTSLLPLTAAPGQTVSADSIGFFTPLTDAKASFGLTTQGLELESASAKAAHGVVAAEPMTVSFKPGAPLAGALVLKAVDLGEIIRASSLADSVELDAVVDGRLPFSVTSAGFRFADGRIAAIKPGRISISRKALAGIQAGDATATGAAVPVNAGQELAYQAMEDLAFDKLEARIDSRAAGRLGVLFTINGRHAPPLPVKATFTLAELISGQAFKKAVPLPSDTPINLTLDTSLNFDELVNAVRAIWSRDRRSAEVQPAKALVAAP